MFSRVQVQVFHPVYFLHNFGVLLCKCLMYSLLYNCFGVLFCILCCFQSDVPGCDFEVPKSWECVCVCACVRVCADFHALCVCMFTQTLKIKWSCWFAWFKSLTLVCAFICYHFCSFNAFKFYLVQVFCVARAGSRGGRATTDYSLGSK